MNTLDPVFSAALEWSLKASVLLAFATVVQAVLLRSASAAARHLVWTFVLVGLLLLPVLSIALPQWTMVSVTSNELPTAHAPLGDLDRMRSSAAVNLATAGPDGGASESDQRDHQAAPAKGRVAPWPGVFIGLYAAGALLMLVHMSIQQWRVARITRKAVESRDGAWTQLLRESAATLGVRQPVRLLRSRDCSMPMAIGTRAPAIVIPAVADTWPEDRRRAVMLHELAHVARRDCLVQSLALAARTMYWFHPGVWWVARRVRIERELACDDRVIASGSQARDYAAHLLEIAFSLGREQAPALAVAMARQRQLEGRLLAALDTTRNRGVPPFGWRVAGVLFGTVLLLPLASATATVVAVGRHEQPTATPVVSEHASPSPPDAISAKQRQRLEWPGVDSARRFVHEVIAAVQERAPGTWEIRPTGTEGTVHLRLTELNSSSASNVPIASLEGLTAAQLAGVGGPVQFRLRRDAGTMLFEGVVRSGVGAGTFSFTPDPNFPAELERRGFSRPTSREQYQLARHDIGYAFVDELTRQGYAKPPTSELVRAGQHGVQTAYLREMGALGYRLGSLAPLITLRDHGVGPTYIRDLIELGYKGLSADDLRQARDHGVSAEYVKEMRDAGFAGLTIEQLIKARDHGVGADDARELGAVGLGKLPLDQLIRARDHGVSSEYARQMRELGYRVSLDELIGARDHGVDTGFVREFSSLGYTALPLQSLIRLRDHGVTSRYVQELKALGYDRLPVDDLVTLRDYRLTADRIREANRRAGTRLPVDLLKRLSR